MGLKTTPTATAQEHYLCKLSEMREGQWRASKRRCTKNCLVGLKEEDISFRDEPIHAKRGRNVGAFVPGVAGVAVNMVSGDVNLIFGSQVQVITVAGQANVSSSVSDTKGNTRSMFGSVQDTHPFTTRDKKVDPS